MKTKILIQLIIFIIAFVEVLLVILIPYFDGFNCLRLEGSSYWGVVLLLNSFILTLVLLKGFKSKIKPFLIFLCTTIGAMIFILPYSLVCLPDSIMGIGFSSNLLLGIILAYFIYETKSKIIQIILIIIIILYMISYILFIHQAIFDACTASILL